MKEGERNGYVGGKNPTEAKRWRSVALADSGYQQPTHDAKQPMLR